MEWMRKAKPGSPPSAGVWTAGGRWGAGHPRSFESQSFRKCPQAVNHGVYEQGEGSATV